MKNKLSILLLLLTISFTSLAQTRVMSDGEKASLSVNDEFKKLCKQNAINHAVFLDNGEAGFPANGGLANRDAWIKYVKDLIFATNIVIKGEITDEDIGKKYLALAKSKEFTLGVTPQSDSTLIATWVAGNVFAEFNPGYFSLLGNAYDTDSKEN